MTGDIQISIITTGYYEEYHMGTLVLDGEEIHIFLIGGRGNASIFKLDDIDVINAVEYNRSDYEILCVSYTDYKKSVTFTIIDDNTKRENKESLVGRKLVLVRHDLY